MATLFQQRIDLGDNENREIDNPLAYIEDLDALDADARQFAARVNPEAPDCSLWTKAARVARDPLGISKASVPGLTDQEENVLLNERFKGFWQQPKTLRTTIAALCIGAVVQGWTQSGGNGANETWPQQFGLDINSNKITKDHWIYSAVNAITYLAAAVFGCWLSDPLQSWLLGRRGAIFFSALLILASVVGAACTYHWVQLFVCRLILGLGMGAKASVVPIFGAEVSPPHLRGALVMNWQLFDALGIFFGFTANLIVSGIGPLAWRFQVASIVIPTICLLTLIWATPESPRFLLKKGRLREAYESLLVLRETPIQAARELYYANAQIQAEISLLPQRPKDDVELSAVKEGDVPVKGSTDANGFSTARAGRSAPLRRRAARVWDTVSQAVDDSQLDDFQRRIKRTNYFTRLWQLFRDKRTRRATIAAFVVMIGQQFCGINILAIYSSTFFEDVNNGHANAAKQGIWFSWGIGLANFLFTFPTYYFIDKRGRRFLLLATYPGMAISLLAACLSFNIPDSHSSRPVAISIFIFIFIFFYSWGQGPVAFAYSSEVFPLLNREQGMSFAVFINLLFLGLLTLFVPVLTTKLQNGNPSPAPGQSKLLGIFAGFNIIALLLIFFLVPETAGATLGKQEGSLNYISLEELNYIFGVSTVKHIRYQLQHVVPWSAEWIKYWIRKYILRRRDGQQPEQTEDLYYWVSVRRLQRQERTRNRSESEDAEREEDPDDTRIVPDETDEISIGDEESRP